MRDIQNDLRERLAAVEARYAETHIRFGEAMDTLQRDYREAVAQLDKERTILAQALDIEARREGSAPQTAVAESVRRRLPLADFIVTKVHAQGPLSKDEIRAEASLAGYMDEANGRDLHMALVNAVKHGKLNKLPGDRFVFPAAPESLFGMGSSEEGATMQ